MNIFEGKIRYVVTTVDLRALPGKYGIVDPETSQDVVKRDNIITIPDDCQLGLSVDGEKYTISDHSEANRRKRRREAVVRHGGSILRISQGRFRKFSVKSGDFNVEYQGKT